MDRHTITALLFIALTMVTMECQALPTKQDQDGSLLETTNIGFSVVQNQDHHRQLQYSNGNTCGITGYSVYNSLKAEWQPLASVVINELPHAQLILDTYHHMQAINIQTHVDVSGCAAKGLPSVVRCVKMKLFNSTYYYDYSSPYTLYPPVGNLVGTTKPAKLGFQYFDVELFENATCDGYRMCFDTLNLHFVNKPVEFRTLSGIRATYSGLQTTPTNTIGNRMGEATCAYIKKAIQTGYIIAGSSLGFSEIGWKCNTGSTSSSPPAMTYNINVNFTISSMISVYDNSDPPTLANITSYIRGLFRNSIPGIGYNETMIEYLKNPSTGLTTNPYWHYTNITLS